MYSVGILVVCKGFVDIVHLSVGLIVVVVDMSVVTKLISVKM
jgi:hypothetical protein